MSIVSQGFGTVFNDIDKTSPNYISHGGTLSGTYVGNVYLEGNAFFTGDVYVYGSIYQIHKLNMNFNVPGSYHALRSTTPSRLFVTGDVDVQVFLMQAYPNFERAVVVDVGRGFNAHVIMVRTMNNLAPLVRVGQQVKAWTFLGNPNSGNGTCLSASSLNASMCDLSGSEGVHTGAGFFAGNGGDLSVQNAICANFISNGGNNVQNSGGTGGVLTVSVSGFFNGIELNGGYGGYNGSGGDAGGIYCNSLEVGSVWMNGGACGSSTNGSVVPGRGGYLDSGTITFQYINADSGIRTGDLATATTVFPSPRTLYFGPYSSGVYLSAVGSSCAIPGIAFGAGNGAEINASVEFKCQEINLSGGSVFKGKCGAGGRIVVRNINDNTVSTGRLISNNIHLNGGSILPGGSSVEGANAGSIYCGDLTANIIELRGGSSHRYRAGNGGELSSSGRVSCISISTNGGDCLDPEVNQVPGYAGSILARSLNCGSIVMSGGNLTGTVSGSGQWFTGISSSPNLNILEDLWCETLVGRGGNTLCDVPTTSSGHGAFITVGGTIYCKDTIIISGGHALGMNGGVSGVLTCGSLYAEYVEMNGGNSTGSPQGWGVPQMLTVKNALMIHGSLSMLQGTGLISAWPSYTYGVKCGLDVRINEFAISDSSQAVVESGLSTSLSIGSIYPKTTLDYKSGNNYIKKTISTFLPLGIGFYSLRGKENFPWYFSAITAMN